MHQLFKPSPYKAGFIVVPCAIQVVATGINLAGASQPKPMHVFSPNFQGVYPKRIYSWLGFGGYLATTVAMITLLRFFGLKVCGYFTDRFSPNF